MELVKYTEKIAEDKQDAFWYYDKHIASITLSDGNELILESRGCIEVTFPEKNKTLHNDDAVTEAYNLNYFDSDIKKLNNNSHFAFTNWFEVMELTAEGDEVIGQISQMAGSYDTAIKTLIEVANMKETNLNTFSPDPYGDLEVVGVCTKTGNTEKESVLIIFKDEKLKPIEVFGKIDLNTLTADEVEKLIKFKTIAPNNIVLNTIISYFKDLGSQEQITAFKYIKSLKLYSYTVSTPTIWFNSDNGQVLARDLEEATVIAKDKISEDLNKINSLLNGFDEIKVNLGDVEVKLIENEKI